jgi:hypothetical protein
MVSGECSKHEAQILLLVARMTISFRRELAPISKSVVGKFTGIRGSGALHALTALESAGLIRRIPGNERRPSQVGLRLDPDWEWLRADGERGRAADPADNTTRKTTQGSFPSQDVFVPGDRIAPASLGGINPTRKDINPNDKEGSLSQISQKLREYVDGLRPARKRESEFQALLELRNDFADDDIAECLDTVQTRGVRGAGEGTEPCHSPMAYLAVAMREVLAEVEEQRAKSRARLDREHREVEAASRSAEEEAREAQEWAQKEQAFGREYLTPEQQGAAITELCVGMPFSPRSVAARVFAIGRWWRQGQKHIAASPQEASRGAL